MDIGTIIGLLTGVTAASKNIKDLMAKSDGQPVNSNDFAEATQPIRLLVENPEALLGAISEIVRLQEENKELKDWDKVEQGYELRQTEGGAHVYASDTPFTHYLCPSCFAKKRKQILQDNNNSTGYFTCRGCDGWYSVMKYKSQPNKSNSAW